MTYATETTFLLFFIKFNAGKRKYTDRQRADKAGALSCRANRKMCPEQSNL